MNSTTPALGKSSEEVLSRLTAASQIYKSASLSVEQAKFRERVLNVQNELTSKPKEGYISGFQLDDRYLADPIGLTKLPTTIDLKNALVAHRSGPRFVDTFVARYLPSNKQLTHKDYFDAATAEFLSLPIAPFVDKRRKQKKPRIKLTLSEQLFLQDARAWARTLDSSNKYKALKFKKRVEKYGPSATLSQHDLYYISLYPLKYAKWMEKFAAHNADPDVRSDLNGNQGSVTGTDDHRAPDVFLTPDPVVASELNGNMGEWTNGDDMVKKHTQKPHKKAAKTKKAASPQKMSKKIMKKEKSKVQAAYGTSDKRITPRVPRVKVAEMIQTFVQANSDTFPLYTSFQIPLLTSNSAGSILLSMTLSIGNLDQYEQADLGQGNGQIAGNIRNYAQFCFTKINLALKNQLPGGVSGSLAICWVPVDVQVDSTNFVSYVDSRRTPNGFFPGTSMLEITSRNQTSTHHYNGEWTRGARPIGLTNSIAGSDSKVGRLIVGVYTDLVVADYAGSVAITDRASSSVSSTAYIGKVAHASLIVAGDWIYRIPIDTSVFPEYTRTLIDLPFGGPVTVVNRTVGIGVDDYFGGVPLAPVPPFLAESAANSYQSNSQLSPETTSSFSTALVNDELVNAVVSLGWVLAQYADEKLSSSGYPPIISILYGGGLAMSGYMDTRVGTPTTLSDKDIRMTQTNDLDVNTGWNLPSSVPEGGVFTPQASSVPANWPTTNFSTVPASNARQATYGTISALPADSALAMTQAIASDAQRAVGFYPVYYLRDLQGSGAPAEDNPYDSKITVDSYVTNAGGVERVLPCATFPFSDPTDTLAGIPLAAGRQVCPSSICSSRFSSNIVTPKYMHVKNDSDVDFYRTLSDAQQRTGGFLSKINVIATDDEFCREVFEWFGTEAAYENASQYVWSFKAGYVAMGVFPVLTGGLDGAVSLDANPFTGVISGRLSFSAVSVGWQFIERVTRRVSDGLLREWNNSTTGSVLYKIHLGF